MLIAGDADSVYVPPAYIEELEDVEGLTVYKDLPTLNVDAFFFQFDINPESAYFGSGQLDGDGIPLDFFNDPDVRKGFAYAFDFETFLNDAVMGEGQRAASPVVEGLPYYNPDQEMYPYDLALAKEHLEKAWGGAVLENGFTFTLTYNSGNDTRKTACEILQAGLLSVNDNFHVSIQVVQWPTFLHGMVAQTLPMFCIGWLPDYPDPHNYVQPFMHSAGLFSGWQSYSNPEVDTLIAQGIASTDPAERQVIYYELQKLYYEEIPSFPVVQPQGRRYFRDWVKGFYYNPVLPSNLGNIYALSKEY